MVIILSRPPVGPPVPVDAFRSLSYEWITWEGETYSLSDWQSGLVLDNRGVEGLHFPRITKQSSTSRAFPGKRRRGWRAESRDVFWPIQIWGDSSAEWLERYERFFASIHPEKEGTWRVGVGDGSFRELKLTGRFDDSHEYALDPVLEAWGAYGVTLEADQPFWRGKPVKAGPWRAPTSVSFIDPAGSAPYHISRGSTFTSAKITNPGDVDAWPVWTLIGPLDPIEVGVASRIIDVPFPLTGGQTLKIDTDPRNVTALLNGVDITADLGFQPFAPVAAKETVPLHISTVGTGSVEIEMVPLYMRAF